jgi:hypothetical protein
MRGNAFVGNVSPNFIRLDQQPRVAQLAFNGEPSDANSYAVAINWFKTIGAVQAVKHPSFPAAGQGIFSHISELPTVDYFGNPLSSVPNLVGAGYQPLTHD